jgi:formylglycine-generating enzyme required for sulfatase activity
MTFATLAAQGEAAAFKDELACNSPRQFTTVPGSFDANAFGVYDVLGNVWESVEDCWHPNYEGAPVDGSAWKEQDCKQRISRGGGYSSPAWLARAATRGVVAPDHRGLDAGLRVARDLD